MHVRLLGSLEIESDDRVVSLGGQQRRVLISLALEPHGLHREVLEERLGLSRGGLRTSVTRLRSAIGSESVVSIENGYRLVAATSDIDEFEELLRRASTQAVPTRIDTLTVALALWRGTALQDVADEDWARPTAVRLNELQVAASEDLAEGLVEAERTTEAIALLRVLSEDHPYRDRACGLLITALALEGRQTEALRAFNDHRARLIDEVGIDPSEELVDLDRRIAMGESVAPLPTAKPLDPDEGLLTFLFTDIVGSTARWHEDPEEMLAALMRHDAAMKAAVARASGRIVKHTGDGCMAVFREPDAAVAAAIQAQRTIELPIRVGMHLGSATHRDNDYFGPAVNRAARIMAVAHGGQVLLSPEVATYLTDHETVELGRHQLRPELEPEQLVQLVHPDLQDSFPGLAGALATPHNLPTYPSAFIGRDEDVAELAGRVLDHRMVSLVGMGGAGKTRLAIAAAESLLDEFPHGVHFIELASLSPGQSICAAIRIALGLGEGIADDDVEDVRDLGGLLSDHRSLLVLDNCEHLGTAPSLVTEQLLLAAPDLHILATSRLPLGVADESVSRISALELDDAVGLFEARARAAEPSFIGDDRTLDVVRDICQQLDQLPLGVELAAAQVAVLAPTEIRDRLAGVLGLRNARVSVSGRQETLRMTLAWSLESVGAPAQQLLGSLSVLAGQFSLDAVEALAGCEEPGANLLADLGELVQRGLVVRDASSNRYRLLHLVRTFAQDQADRDTLGPARQRHAAFYTSQAAALTADIYRAGASADLSDLANLRDAASHLLEVGDALGVIQLIVAGAEYWSHAGAAHDIDRWLHEALAMDVELPVDLHVAALATVTSALTIARPSGGRAIDLGLDAVALADRPEASLRSQFVAACELGYAYVHADASDPRGPDWLNRSLEVAENNPLRMMRSYSRLSVAAFIGGKPQNGLEPAERAVAIAQAAGVTVFEKVARSFRAATRAVLGDQDGAMADLAHLRDVAADLDPVWRSTIHVTAANAWLALGDQGQASAHLVPALGLPLGDVGEVICTMIGSTACMLDRVPPEIVAAAIGAIRQFHSATQPMLDEQLSAAELRVRQMLDDEAFAIAKSLGERETIGATNLQIANALSEWSTVSRLAIAS